jgi:hypothetical protein
LVGCLGIGVQGYSPGKLERSRSDEENERSLFSESSQVGAKAGSGIRFSQGAGFARRRIPRVSLGFTCWLAFARGDVINCNLSFSNIAVILNNSSDGCNPILSRLLFMTTDSKSKKSASPVDENQVSDVQPDPDGFLSELNSWGLSLILLLLKSCWRLIKTSLRLLCLRAIVLRIFVGWRRIMGLKFSRVRFVSIGSG